MGYRRELLEEAADLVEGDRNAQYGDPNQDFRRTAAMWNAYISGLAERKGVHLGDLPLIEPQDVSWLMILLKASRSTVSPDKRDHYADAAGYAACGADVARYYEPEELDYAAMHVMEDELETDEVQMVDVDIDFDPNKYIEWADESSGYQKEIVRWKNIQHETFKRVFGLTDEQVADRLFDDYLETLEGE